MRKKISAILLNMMMAFALLCLQPFHIFADSAPGDVIVTLGEDLTDAQKKAILSEMGQSLDSQIVYVTNKEEHEYLGKYISKAQIGTKALSSSKITVGEKNSGLTVKSNNINWVTNEMYENALTTAGVTDAEVYVTAPFPVSGTAALTGILKAYEISMDTKIPEEQKQIANEEMVKTAKLGDRVGSEQAADLMSLIKTKMSGNMPKTDEELKTIITESANQLNISLSNEEIQGLVDLFDKMKELNIDWNQVGENLQAAKQKFEEFLNQEDTKNFIQKLGEFFSKLIDAIKSWFN